MQRVTYEAGRIGWSDVLNDLQRKQRASIIVYTELIFGRSDWQ